MKKQKKNIKIAADRRPAAIKSAYVSETGIPETLAEKMGLSLCWVEKIIKCFRPQIPHPFRFLPGQQGDLETAYFLQRA